MTLLAISDIYIKTHFPTLIPQLYVLQELFPFKACKWVLMSRKVQ